MKARILSKDFKYVPAVATNVQDTWRKFGWRPSSEVPDVRSVDKRVGDVPVKSRPRAAAKGVR